MFKKGFTIVELLIVIIVIGILAAIVFVSYRGIADQSKNSTAVSGAKQARTKILTYATQNSDQYPADLNTIGLSSSNGTTYSYSVNNSSNPKTFCLTSTSSGVSYYVSNTISSPASGSCPVVIGDGSFIQDITSSNCPTTKIRAVDARDNHTYWVQKLADGKCWMLTNLAYAGGGTNTYGDVKTLIDGTSDSAYAYTYTDPKYYVIPSTTNYTTEPTNPSVSTSGSGQYGYLYNFCAANGGQTGNGACSSTSSATLNTSISVCPAGWRLPTGTAVTGDFTSLNSVANNGVTSNDVGLLLNWLGQTSGNWAAGFGYQGSQGVYWSSTQGSAPNAYFMVFLNYSSNPSNSNNKGFGLAVRCLAI